VQHILLIETSATLRHVTEKLFTKHQYKVTACSTYIQALEKIIATDNNGKSPYQCIVLGWPDHTDHDADEIIALLSEPQYGHYNVIVLSHEADTSKLDWVSHRKQTALILWENHIECVNILTEMQTPKPEINANSGDLSDGGPPIKILFVDDSPTVRVNFRRLLNSNGYITDTASGVAEGYDKAIENTYDIAIIDYFMADGTGDSLCALLRDNPNTANITTAIITGTYHDKVIKDSLDAGASECMFKSEANELFLARIKSMSRMKHAMSSIEKERKRFECILSSVGDGVYGVNNDNLITFMNPAAKILLGYNIYDNLIGQSPSALFFIDPQEIYPTHEHTDLAHTIYGSAEELTAEEKTFKRIDDELITVECTAFPLIVDNVSEGSVIAFRDVTERKLLEDELKWQAYHDPLTKLGNRLYFEEELRSEIARLKNTDQQSALLYLDLDRFKYINDTAGHSAGDKLLIEIGNQLSGLLTKDDLLARIGGDEFAIILKNTSKNQACSTANLYRNVLENYYFNHNGKAYVVNGSIGIAPLNHKTKSHDEALSNADLACFLAKGKGRNNIHLFVKDNDAQATMDRDLGWSVRIKEALANDEFILYFQPIVSLASIDTNTINTKHNYLINFDSTSPNITIKCNEVLLRMSDSNGNLISPDAFLPTAERFNLMSDIDRWVIRKSVETLVKLKAHDQDNRLSINLSAQTLKDKHLVSFIKELANTNGIDPRLFLFEVTESSAIENLEDANRLINELRKLGCQFALDDFGKGFSSFSHLKYLPVDFIKIDGIFVQGILENPIDRAIVNSVVQIAHSVGKKTIAEYVENIEIIKVLKKMRVDFVQGHYISKPKDKPAQDKSVADKNNDASGCQYPIFQKKA